MKICLSCDGVAATTQDRCSSCGIPLLPTTAVHFPLRRGEVDAGNPLLGTVLDGKFLLQGVLGRGGMGTVFRASHAVSQVPVAIKLLHPRLSSRGEYRRTLIGEARKVGRVVHEHCARVLDAGETEEGTVYLAMELAEGEPLEAWLRDGPLPVSVALDVLTQIARALVAIHAAGLVHRDLSSRNVMIALRNGAPFVKVLDFGIAQSVALAKSDDRGGEVAFANPVFSAPEHLAGSDVDARADLYSFGVVAYLVLTGRLPVEQADARSAARATIAGELLPLGNPPGVPRRLVRLVSACLSRDRQERPKTAAAVLSELQAMAPDRTSWLPSAAVALSMASVVAALLTFGRSAPPFLRLMGDKLTLLDGTLSPSTPVQYLRSGDVATLRGTFGGFEAEKLVVEVWRSGQVLVHQPLRPRIESEGTLRLDESQIEWGQVVDRLRTDSRQGPIDLLFLLPTLAVLGDARLQLDDQPPDLRSDIDGGRADGRALLANAVARWQVEDQTGLAEFELRARLADGRAFTRALPLETGTAERRLGEDLQAAWGGPGPLGAGEVVLVAVDRSGNRTSSQPVAFDVVDVDVPRVTQVTGIDGESVIPYLGGRASVRVQLTGVEPGLRFSVLDGRGDERLAPPLPEPDALGACRMELRAGDARPGEDPFPSGVWRVVVTDPAGNRSEQPVSLTFRSRSIDAVLVEPRVGAARVGDELVLAAEATAACEFTCNSSFLPVVARVQALTDGPMGASEDLPLRNARPGGAGLVLGGLAPGLHQLELQVREQGVDGARPTAWRQRLRVLPRPLVLHVPDNRGRFLQQLRQSGLFLVDGDQLREGSFRVDGDLRRYLRGSLWTGPDPNQLAARPLLEPEDPAAPLMPSLRVTSGRNVLALELRDVLGRPAAVVAGDGPAAALRVGERELALLADFHHAATPAQWVGEDVRVEFEQPTRVRLRSPLPFTEADRPALRLSVGGAEWPAAAVRTEANGADLEFVVPFRAWVDAAGLESVKREAFASGLSAEFESTLRTPAGAMPLRITLRTARTTLRALRLGELAPIWLPEALAAIEMVPLLSPPGGYLPDPVPEDAPGRALFRPQPPLDVRNVPDVFVQRGEFTQAQYAALLGLVATAVDDDKLVHADDPLGGARLQRINLLPLPWAQDEAGFFAAAQTAPDAAVQGLDFFQAYTATRLLARQLGGDPELLRLPFGCELEHAAFGAEVRGAARHGAAAQRGAIDGARWREAGALAAPRTGGATAVQCAAAGDAVPSPFGGVITGLDFGVREWVLDLPWGADLRNEFALPEWSSDHATLSARVQQFARGVLPPANLQARLRTFGVVRGLPLGAATGLLDEQGAPLRALDFARLPASVPGVVRTEQVRRDGRGLLPGAIDPRVLQTGFRLAGGPNFVQRVRGT